MKNSLDRRSAKGRWDRLLGCPRIQPTSSADAWWLICSGTQNTAWLEWAPPSRAMIGSDSQWWGWVGGGCMHVTKNVFEGVRTQQHSSLSTHMARPIKQSTHKCRRSQEAEKYVPNQLREHRARRRAGQQPQRHQQKTSFSNAADHNEP